MKKLLCGLGMVCLSNFASAELHIMSAWAPETFKLAKTGAAYIKAHNMSDNDVAIVNLTVPQEVANKVELHETVIENEMASMRPLPIPYILKSGDALMMEQGGKHIMLLGLKAPLESGNDVPLTLHYADGSSQTFMVTVDDSATKTDHEMDHSHHH